jgi:hypothetical protein
MDKKKFLMTLWEQYGLKIDGEGAERMAQSGGPLDMVNFIRAILLRIDVSGYRPMDESDFGLEEVKK